MTFSPADATGGPVVLVFEAGSESGSDLIRVLLAVGCRIVATDRYATDLAGTSSGYPADRVYLVAADPTDPRQLERLIRRACGRFGSLHCAVAPGVATRASGLGFSPSRNEPRRQHRCADSGRSSAR